MITIEKLKKRYEIRYSNSVTKYTQEKRRVNINSFNSLIERDIDKYKLKYNEYEMRMLIYETNNNEQIYIQYPGLISIRENKPFKMDFKPIIIDSNGNECIDATFQMMWDIFANIVKGHRNMLPILSTIFFRMGRMIEYKYSINKCKLLLKSNEILKDINEYHELEFYKIKFEKEEIEALNYNVGEIKFQEGFSVSFEAFIYFFDMILQIEDCKYYIFSNKKLKSGRIPTSDSMVLIASFYNEYTSLSSMLQKFVKGNGVALCRKDEYISASNGAIEFINEVDYIKNKLDKNKIIYKEGSKTIDRIPIKPKLYLADKKIAFYDIEPCEIIRNVLLKESWSYVTINKEFEYNTIDDTLNNIINLY
ncbi:hypothetical protein [Clostridium sp.]|uniref:hypothetical protein n=1 Tax=Clostridium sp. TaxID=1506 RepID=UPI002901A9FB|nr:hypothetical protein [Clostridium sp.]MBS7132071.1 hypothetical protein [Clostridium sp.]MDU2284346.1 hypothetical protein [Clostridium sp.]